MQKEKKESQGWADYNIVSDKIKTWKNGAQGHFYSNTVSQWTASNELAFGWDMLLHFRDYPYGKGYQKFSSKAACQEFYKKKVETFGTCGGNMVGWSRWRKGGCSMNMGNKPAPVHRNLQQSHAPLATQDARIQQHHHRHRQICAAQKQT